MANHTKHPPIRYYVKLSFLENLSMIYAATSWPMTLMQTDSPVPRKLKVKSEGKKN